ncbi:MAG: energy-coupling factor ABC transporter substrate-binding protein [Sebaldella sp.]|nr:energy-coupling factor ABC transporter substrate-binding protein [Sebaldella sp.]
MSIFKKNILLVCVAVLIGVIPLLTIKNSEFGGADGKAEELIGEINPDYEPWASSIITLPGGETESLLFALQAAIGAGVMGYVLGYFKGKSKNAD